MQAHDSETEVALEGDSFKDNGESKHNITSIKMPVTSDLTSENSVELAETMPGSQLAYFRDLHSSGLTYTWPYADTTTNIHYRLQPLAINPAFLHFAQREAFSRAFFSLYDQRAFLDSYRSTSYTPAGRDEEKPKQSYVRLIGEAILNSPEKKLVLSEIYKTIQTKYPYFKNRGSGWKNSIRHNLSLNDCFVKLGRSPNGKGHFWTLSPQHYEEFLRGSSHQRKFQKKAAPKFCYYPSEVFQFNNYAMVDSPPSTEQSTAEGRTEIHIPADQIEVKHEVVISSEDEVEDSDEKSVTSRPFDVENLLATHPKRPASY